MTSDCAELVRSGHKFSYVAVEDRLRAASLKDCSNKCSRETDCNTFSYRWTERRLQMKIYIFTLFSSFYNGDCSLSRLEAASLLSQDISYERDSDIYRPLFGGNCGPGYYPNHGGNTGPQHHQGHMSHFCLSFHCSYSGCARIWRGQSKLSRLASRESLTAQNLRDCQDLCETSQQFTCRSFSFISTAGYSGYNYPNCELSELDERNLNDRDLEPDYSGDVYVISSSCGGGGDSGHTTGSSYISK